MSNTISILLLPGGGELRYSIYLNIGMIIQLITLQKEIPFSDKLQSLFYEN